MASRHSAEYMRNSAAANSAASSPPVPARTSRWRCAHRPRPWAAGDLYLLIELEQRYRCLSCHSSSSAAWPSSSASPAGISRQHRRIVARSAWAWLQSDDPLDRRRQTRHIRADMRAKPWASCRGLAAPCSERQLLMRASRPAPACLDTHRFVVSSVLASTASPKQPGQQAWLRAAASRAGAAAACRAARRRASCEQPIDQQPASPWPASAEPLRQHLRGSTHLETRWRRATRAGTARPRAARRAQICRAIGLDRSSSRPRAAAAARVRSDLACGTAPDRRARSGNTSSSAVDRRLRDIGGYRRHRSAAPGDAGARLIAWAHRFGGDDGHGRRPGAHHRHRRRQDPPDSSGQRHVMGDPHGARRSARADRTMGSATRQPPKAGAAQLLDHQLAHLARGRSAVPGAARQIAVELAGKPHRRRRRWRPAAPRRPVSLRTRLAAA